MPMELQYIMVFSRVILLSISYLLRISDLDDGGSAAGDDDVYGSIRTM